MDMHDHVVALREDALDLALVVRELLTQEIDEALDAIESVGADRVVLDIGGSDIGLGLLEVLLVQHRIVEFDHVLLVAFQLLCVGRLRLRQRRGEREGSANHECKCRSDHAVLPLPAIVARACMYAEKLLGSRFCVNRWPYSASHRGTCTVPEIPLTPQAVARRAPARGARSGRRATGRRCRMSV